MTGGKALVDAAVGIHPRQESEKANVSYQHFAVRLEREAAS